MLRSTTRLLPLALSLALVACQDDGLTGPEDGGNQIGTGKGFTLLLTDAPGDFESAVVTIDQINLQGAGKSVDLLDEPFTGDLIDLRNQVATLVSGMDLPAGSYSQLRLVLGGAYLEVETANGTKIYASSPDYDGLPDGAHVDGTLVMPSMGQSGLKINLPGGKLDIGEGETIVMLDFDAAESFGHEAGNSGRWIMHPVVKATNVTFGGNALVQLKLGTGVTLPTGFALGGFKATLTPVGGGTPIELTFTDADADGVYEALYKGLLPGQYQLALVSPAGLVLEFGGATFPLNVTVGQKTTTTNVITISAASLAPATVNVTLKLNAGVTLPSLGTPPVAVTLAAFKAQLTSTAAGATPVLVNFTDANADGTFEASFTNVVPGAYTLTIVRPTGVTATYDVTVPVNVDLTPGEVETKAFVITAAAAG